MKGERCYVSNSCPVNTIGSGTLIKTNTVTGSDGSVWDYYAFSSITPSVCKCDAGGQYKTCGTSWKCFTCPGNINDKCGKKTLNNDHWVDGRGPSVPVGTPKPSYIFECSVTTTLCGQKGCD
jgi:hypothetical protein